MKINLVLPGAGNCGGVRIPFMYLNYFSKKGHDVICYVPLSGDYFGWKRILFLKSIFRIAVSKDLQGKWFKKNFSLKFVPLVNNCFIRNADITIATSWLTSYWVEKLNRKKGKKVYFIQGYETWGSKKQNILVRKSYKLPYDLRISVSNQLKNKLIRNDNCSSRVINNGIQLKYIRKEEIFLKKRNVTIGMPYRSSDGGKDIKNCKLGLHVLESVKNEKKDVNLKVFGLNKPSVWNDNIEFTENPRRSKLTEWYDSVDIFYVPSLYEGWGLPAMEAMARGCAVIAANIGCIYEFGKNRFNCLILNDPNDKDETVEKINLLIDNYKLRREIGVNALNDVKKYTFESSSLLFERALDEIL